MHPPEAVANYFLKQAWGENKDLTPIQAIKLVYIAHGWNLGYFDNPLISGRIEAWKYGPVIPSLYREFKIHGNQPIPDLVEDYSGPVTSNFSGQDEKLLSAIWENYGEMQGFQLSSLTHNEGTPWFKVWREKGGSQRQSAPIDSETIKQYYQRLIEN